MDSSMSRKMLGIILFLIIPALIIALGYISHSFWVSMIIFVGIILLLRATISARRFRYKHYSLYSLLGLALIVSATWLSRMNGRWLWTPIWLFTGIMISSTGIIKEVKKETWISKLAVLTGLSCVIFSFIGPSLLYSIIEGTVSGISFTGLISSFNAVWSFLVASSKLIWGFVYLFLLFLIGKLWIKKWSGFFAVSVMFAAVLLSGDLDLFILDKIVLVFSTNPVTLIQDILLLLARSLGSLGWGILLISLIMAALLSTANRILVHTGSGLNQGYLISRLLGVTLARERLVKQGHDVKRVTLASLLKIIIGFGIPVIVWIVLRHLTGMQAEISFSFLVIPDLTVPSLKPVWHSSYLILALILIVVNLNIFRIQKKYRFFVPVIYSELIVVTIWPIIIALFIPAGVLLLLLAQSIGLYITLMSITRKQESVATSEPVSKSPLPQEGSRTGTILRSGLPAETQEKQKSLLEIAEQKGWEVKSLPVWEPGDVILETYEVEDVISGGMGYVYIANHKRWKRKLAIKSPNEMMLSQKDHFARILREANAWVEMGMHPNIAYCYYVRNIEDVPHIVVEYVDGGDLKEWIEEGRCIDYRVNLDLAIQFCHGMEFAHSKGMIHRDIKPANILMTKDGVLKITDFGLVRGQESGVRDQVSEIRDQKTEGR